MVGIYALTLVFFLYAVGDIIAFVTKSIIPSPLARTIVILGGLWLGIIPQDTFTAAQISGFGMLVVALMIACLGNTLDFAELKRQWKTVVICIVTVVVSSAVIMLAGPILVGAERAYVGAPIFAGGGAAQLLLISVLRELEGKADVIGFLVMLGTTQGYFGVPMCAFFLRRYSRRFLAEEGNVDLWAEAHLDRPVEGQTPKRKPLQLPAELNRVPIYLLKIGLVASLGNWVSVLTNACGYLFYAL